MKKLFKEVLPVAAIVASAFSVLTVTSGSTQANSASQNTTSTTQTTAMAVLPGQPVVGCTRRTASCTASWALMVNLFRCRTQRFRL